MSTLDNRSNAELGIAGLKQRSLHGAAATAGSQGIKFLISLISQIWLARLISPAEYGLVAMVAPILGFIAIISDLGIGTAVVQQESISQSQISALFWLNATVSLLISLGLVAISPLVGLLYHEPKTVGITIAMAALFWISTFGIHPSAILTREMRLVSRAVIDSVAASLGLIAGVITAKQGWGYWSLIYLQAVSTVASLVLTWWFAAWLPSRPSWDKSATRIMRFGTSITVSNFAFYLSGTADNMIVGAVRGKVALGFYDKAYRLVVIPILQLYAPLGRVAVPLLSRLKNEPERYASAFRKMIQIPNLIGTPALICGMFLAPELVQVFLGPTWKDIAPVFSWVCFGALASLLYGSASWLFTSQGRGRDLMKWSLITAGISVASFVIGIRWGAVGVAFSAGMGFVFLQTPLIMRAATRIGPVTGRNVIDAIRPILVSFFITVPAVYMYSRTVHMAALLQLCGGAMLTIAVYMASLAAMYSGRELLRGTSLLLFGYFKSLRDGYQRATP